MATYEDQAQGGGGEGGGRGVGGVGGGEGGFPPYRNREETVIPQCRQYFEDIAMSLVNQEIILEALVLSHTTFLKTNSSQAELRKRSTSAKGSQRSIIMKERHMTHFTDFYCYLCVCAHNLNMLCT